MSETAKAIAAYLFNLILTAISLFILWFSGFQLSKINPQLLAGVFTLVVSSAAVLFTSVTDNEQLMVAAERKNQLTYLVSAFTVPILLSLIGLISSIIAFSFDPPEGIGTRSPLINWLIGATDWFLVGLVLWVSFGFLSSVGILILLEYGMAKERSN